MEKSVLHELLPYYNERTKILYLLLGVISLSERWMYLITAQHVGTQRPVQDFEPKISGFGAYRDGPDPSLIHFLLGMIAFSDHIHDLLLVVLRLQSAPETEAEAPVSMHELRRLLR